jgi:hypothetical protein
LLQHQLLLAAAAAFQPAGVVQVWWVVGEALGMQSSAAVARHRAGAAAAVWPLLQGANLEAAGVAVAWLLLQGASLEAAGVGAPLWRPPGAANPEVVAEAAFRALRETHSEGCVVSQACMTKQHDCVHQHQSKT